MNLNEVKKHVIFNCILYVLIVICFLLSLFAILIIPAHAAEIKTTNITAGVANTTNCGTKANGSYCWGQWGTSSVAWTKTTFGASNGYAVSDLAFDMNGTFPQYFNVPATLQLKSSTNSFKNTTYSCSWSGSNQPTSCSVTRVSSNQLNINFRTPLSGTPQYLYISIGSDDPSTYLSNININQVILLQTVDDPNAGVIENQNQNTSQIINNQNENTQQQIQNQNQNTQQQIQNQNQNTQNIINNQDANSEKTNNIIIDSTFGLIKQFSNMCTNVTNTEYYSNCKLSNNGNLSSLCGSIYYKSLDTGTIYWTSDVAWSGVHSDYIQVLSGTKYYLKFSGNFAPYVKIVYFNSDKQVLSNTTYSPPSSGTTVDWNFTTPSGTNYIRVSIEVKADNIDAKINNLYLSTTNASFCAYGSTTGNKLDIINGALGTANSAINTTNTKLQQEIDLINQQKNLQQQQNNYLMDDTDPSVNSNGINNVINSVNYSDPLNYLLTLPIHLLQKINTVLSANSCSRVSFGELYGTELYLPCINFSNLIGSGLWNTIDLFAAVGLLAVILKKFYDSISNILTLGKEKEVKEKLDLPTPMQFLASILGGGRD